jgi:hypothetical protein
MVEDYQGAWGHILEAHPEIVFRSTEKADERSEGDEAQV